MLKLNTKLVEIRGIGEKFLSKLATLEIKTVKDLLWHFPFRYEDFSKIVKIADLQMNQAATVQAIIQKISVRRTWHRKMLIVEATLADDTGEIRAIWFNQPYIARVLSEGAQANFAGKVTTSNEEIYLSNPTYERLYAGTETRHTARLIPIYSETRGLTSKGIRYLIKPILNNLEKVKESIPREILGANDLPEINAALKHIHFPRAIEEAETARRRFAFEDLFLLQLTNLKMRQQLLKKRAPILKIRDEELQKIINGLPFQLTNAQMRSLNEIVDNLASAQPMNRLLQGDVGSGKTIVAAIAALIAAKNNKQTAFMAPTEVLARQHYQTLTNIFKNAEVGIGLLTGGEARSFYGDNLEAKQNRADFLKEVGEGKINIIIGTHALITSNSKPRSKKKPIMFKDLALVTIDEQHRFGVEQRSALVKQEKNRGVETTVHFLSMSATPIPRTLSLTIFGDLDLSIIDELPAGRKNIITKIVDPVNRNKAYEFIREQIKGGRQVFVICPRIEPVSTDSQTEKSLTKQRKLWNEVRALKEEYEKISKQVFPDLKVAMLHGKMKSSEKEKIMSEFTAGKLDILVSTSVVEVGVDVPNATIMLIEGADRFGLAQLYQFRGRVGRGHHQSFVLLFTSSLSQSTNARLEALLKAKNGFELAEMDLEIRGPGQFLGEKQTGLPDLAMRSLNNIGLVRMARASAAQIIKKDPDLKKHRELQNELSAFQKIVHLE